MTASEWQPLGGDTRGAVTALSQASGDAVFAATSVGVFQSRDAGQTWARAGSAASIAFAETLAARGSSLFAGGADGLHRSLDGGQTWSPILTDARILSVALRAAGPIVVGTETDGALRSDDDGGAWSSANAGLVDLTVMAIGLSPDFDADGLAFAGTTSGLYRTRNRAQSWRAVDAGFDEPAIQCVVVGPGAHDERLVVAGTEANGLLYSRDGGTRWDRAPELDGRSVTAVACSRRTTLAAATDAGVALSEDAARGWTVCAPEMTSLLCLLWVVDDQGRDVLLAGSDREGVWRSLDSGRTWTPANAGLHASLLSSLAISANFWRDRTLVVAGPTAGVRVSHDRGETWHEHSTGLGESTILGLAAGARGDVLAATDAGVFVCESAATEQVWRPRSTGDAVGARAVACAGDRALAVLEDGRLLVSDDGRGSWHALTTPFSAGTVVALAASDNSDTLFVATSSSGETVLWRSVDRGATWQRWLVEPGQRAVVSIAVSPNYHVDELVLVGLDRSVLVPSRRAEEVRNGERRPMWLRTTVGPGLPRITSIATLRDPHRVFVSSSAGVFASWDQGRSFAAWNEGLDERPILDVVVSPFHQAEDSVVFALELGGQLWRRFVLA